MKNIRCIPKMLGDAFLMQKQICPLISSQDVLYPHWGEEQHVFYGSSQNKLELNVMQKSTGVILILYRRAEASLRSLWPLGQTPHVWLKLRYTKPQCKSIFLTFPMDMSETLSLEIKPPTHYLCLTHSYICSKTIKDCFMWCPATTMHPFQFHLLILAFTIWHCTWKISSSKP